MPEHQTRAERRAAQARAKRRRDAYESARDQESLLDWDPQTPSQPTPPAPAAQPQQEAPKPQQPQQEISLPQQQRQDTTPALAPLAAPGTGSAPLQAPQSLTAPRESLLERHIRESQEVSTPFVPVSTWFFVGSILALLAYCVGLGVGGPVLGHSLDWRYLAGGAAGILVGGYLAWRFHHEVTTKQSVLTGLAVAVTTIAFTLGSFTSVVIDGKVYASTSRTAKAYDLSTDMYKDLRYMASIDPMLDAAQAQARSEYASYAPTAERLDEIAKKWAQIAADPGSLPSPAFVEVATHTANAADWASKAMKRKGEIILQPDARGEADVNSYRATFQQETLEAGPQLSEVAGLYGISLENGPQE